MRIAIVNDLSLALEVLKRIVMESGVHKIAWVAQTGEEAVLKCASDRPDLVLMDLFMPDMDGVEATRRIMHASPCPILVVTATLDGHAGKVFEAMGHGALDAINTPMMGSGETAAKSRDALLKKITMIEKLTRNSFFVPAKRPAPANTELHRTPLIVMGASTGGPKALSEILSHLPASCGAAIVIVQHVDGEFSKGMASWLDGQTPIKVQLAEEGMHPKRATALLAGKNDHLVLNDDLTLTYRREPLNISFRPSVDVFFKSVAQNWPVPGIAVLLTGMGRDGAEGLKTLYQMGWYTIAQDEATSIVYGMPKAAREIGAAADILPIQQVAPIILKRLKR